MDLGYGMLFYGCLLGLQQRIDKIDKNRLLKALATNSVIDSLSRAIITSLVGMELLIEADADRSASSAPTARFPRRALCERPLVGLYCGRETWRRQRKRSDRNLPLRA